VAAIDVIDSYLSAFPGEARTVASGEWGLTVPAEQAAGWPLDVGLRLAEGLLTVKAHALSSPDGVDPWGLLWWNRQTRFIRFASTQSGEVWVHADLPAKSVDERELDRVLGLVVEGAVAVREQVRARLEPGAERPGGWLAPDA
jgi:hypothetical protein